MLKWKIVIFLCLLLQSFIVAQDNKENNKDKIVYVISLKGEIFESLTQEVKKKLAKVNLEKAQALILEIDTPGGVVSYVLEICEEINRIQKQIPVYAYVLNKALSGGALVSLACDDIYMTDVATLGDAQVKIMTLNGLKDAEEKFASPVRAKFREFAERKGRSVYLAESMVDPLLEVKEVEYKGRETYYLTVEGIAEFTNQKMKSDLNFKPEDIQIVRTVVPSGKLATFTAQEAKKYGFCKEVYTTREEVLKNVDLEGYVVEEITLSTKDSLANFLTNNWVRFFLIVLGILGILLEIWMPGTTLPLIFGITCLALFFLGGYLAEITEIWEIILFVIGVILLAIEIFIIPGFGVVGISGIICCFAAILLSLQTFVIPTNDKEMNIFMDNLFIATLGIGTDIFALFLLSRFLPDAPLGKITVETVQTAQDGYTTVMPGLDKLTGKQGLVLSTLRPAGRAEIEGQSYDVITQGDFIEKGEKIVVVMVEGNRVIVEKTGV